MIAGHFWRYTRGEGHPTQAVAPLMGASAQNALFVCG